MRWNESKEESQGIQPITHILVLQERFELVVGREPHSGLDGVSNHDSRASGIQTFDPTLRQSLLERRDRSDGLVVSDLDFALLPCVIVRQ